MFHKQQVKGEEPLIGARAKKIFGRSHEVHMAKGTSLNTWT